jgi:hypothetical protein
MTLFCVTQGLAPLLMESAAGVDKMLIQTGLALRGEKRPFLSSAAEP